MANSRVVYLDLIWCKCFAVLMSVYATNIIQIW